MVSGAANDPWIDNSEHILLARLGRAKYKSETWRWNGIPAFVATRENTASASWAFLVARSSQGYTLSLSFGRMAGEWWFSKMAGKLSPFRENARNRIRILTLGEICSWEIVSFVVLWSVSGLISVIKTVDFSSVSLIAINLDWNCELIV